MNRGVYSLALRALSPLVWLWMGHRARRAGGQWEIFSPERFGRVAGAHAASWTAPVWVHAVSLGETRAAQPLLQALLDRLLTGDAAAKSLLVEKALDRLGIISRKLLRGFGGEGRAELWTEELIAEAYPRFSKAIDDAKPASVRDSFGLARLQMQRALLDIVSPPVTASQIFMAKESLPSAMRLPSGLNAIPYTP